MIKRLVHFSDLHVRLFKDHDLYKQILIQALSEWKDLKPDRIVFTGDLVNDTSREAEPWLEVFGKIKSKNGIYSMLDPPNFPKNPPILQRPCI